MYLKKICMHKINIYFNMKEIYIYQLLPDSWGSIHQPDTQSCPLETDEKTTQQVWYHDVTLEESVQCDTLLQLLNA